MSKLIPDGWNLARLDEYVEKFLVPMRDKPKNFTGSIPWVRIEDFDGKYLAKSKSFRCVDEDTVSAMKLKVYPVGTVLCSCSARLGVCTIAARELVSNQTFIGLVPSKRILSEYLYYRMQFHADDLQRLSSGTTIAYLPRAKFEEFEILVPPLPEQKKIAAILTSVDEVIEKTQAQIDKLKDLKTGMMQELLTQGVGVDGKPHTEFKDSPIGRIPKGWEVVNVGSLVDVIDPQPDHRTPPEVENGIPYVGLGDIDKSGVINFSGARKVSQAAFEKQCKNFEIHKGAFVFGKIGTIGNPSILPEQRFYCLSANVVLITGVNYEVLRYIFQVFTSGIINEQIAQQTNTTSQPALGIKKVRDFLVPLPTRSEMKSLVDALSSIDQRLTVVKTKLDKLKSSKKALMQDLLTGKVRVEVED